MDERIEAPSSPRPCVPGQRIQENAAAALDRTLGRLDLQRSPWQRCAAWLRPSPPYPRKVAYLLVFLWVIGVAGRARWMPGAVLAIGACALGSLWLLLFSKKYPSGDRVSRLTPGRPLSLAGTSFYMVFLAAAVLHPADPRLVQAGCFVSGAHLFILLYLRKTRTSCLPCVGIALLSALASGWLATGSHLPLGSALLFVAAGLALALAAFLLGVPWFGR